jgi:hypothetical protein
MANEFDSLVAAIVAGSPPRKVFKASQTGEGAGTWHSLWKAATIPAAGSNPPAFTAGSGYVPTDATTGAYPFTNAVGPAQKRLLQMVLTGAVTGTAYLCDRLWACSALLTNTTSAQNITTPGTIPSRDANGAALGDGVELWGEVYAAPGATGATWTVSYTNEAGTAGRSATYTHPANAESVGQMFPFTLQSGDTGVRAVASFTCSVSSGTAGDIGLTLVRRLAEAPMSIINITNVFDFASLGMPRIWDDSCLFWMLRCTSTTTGLVDGSFVIGDYTP